MTLSAQAQHRAQMIAKRFALEIEDVLHCERLLERNRQQGVFQTGNVNDEKSSFQSAAEETGDHAWT